MIAVIHSSLHRRRIDVLARVAKIVEKDDVEKVAILERVQQNLELNRGLWFVSCPPLSPTLLVALLALF